MTHIECEGKLKYPKKEEQMSEEKKLVRAIRGKLGLAGGSIEKDALIPVRAQALYRKIQTAQNNMDILLGPRGDCECEKAPERPIVVETFVTLGAANDEMDALLDRLRSLVGWFVP